MSSTSVSLLLTAGALLSFLALSMETPLDLRSRSLSCFGTGTCSFAMSPDCGFPNSKVCADLQEEEEEEFPEESGYVEGDMIMDARLFRNARLCNGLPCRWPDSLVPYKIDPGFKSEQKTAIMEAIEEYHEKTCIRFREATDYDVDVVYIRPSSRGCSSNVGRIGGMQYINLRPSRAGSGCFRHGTIVHELLHTLGFFHQHSAPDRDQYVKIIWKNLKSGHERDFQKYSESRSTSFGVPYDYGSVMHYPRKAFSKNGKDTIMPLDESASIGQRYELSEKDVMKIHIMYECPPKEIEQTDSNENFSPFEYKYFV